MTVAMNRLAPALPLAPKPEAVLAVAAPVLQLHVVVPCYRVGDALLDLLARIPAEVDRIHVVDDACPDGSGALVEARCQDPRVVVHRNARNLGVGGAVMAGYVAALDAGAEVVVKMDGDGQMDPAALVQLVAPIVRGEADYAKGNRFYDLAQIGRMPRMRILGNAVLSFLNKISSGYWDLFDPTNGYTAIHARVLAQLPLRKVSQRYFFESDMLFRLNIARAVVTDVPMDARYGAETSNLRISRVLFDFGFKHVRNTFKRVFYNYFLRDMSLASLELAAGAGSVLAGLVLGFSYWYESSSTGIPTLPGSVMLVALLLILGLQLLLGFLAYDIASVPRRVLHTLLSGRNSREAGRS